MLSSEDRDFLVQSIQGDLNKEHPDKRYLVKIEQDEKNSCTLISQYLQDKMRIVLEDCVGLYMTMLNLRVQPTIFGRLQRFFSSEYDLELRILATRPQDSYLLPEEEIEAAQRRCMEAIQASLKYPNARIHSVSIDTI